MNRILTLTDEDLENIKDVSHLKQRKAARAVLIDERGAIAIMHAKNRDYFKLPGGGIDPGEGIEDALHRELLEETGCESEIIGEIGEVFEHRAFERMQQTSYCFLARVIGKKGTPKLTKSEKRDGFEVRWFDNIDEAIKLVEQSADTSDILGFRFMTKRDSVILQTAKTLL